MTSSQADRPAHGEAEEIPLTATLEAKVARAIYKALKGAPGSYVTGHPDTDPKTTVDGSFSLRYVAKRVLATVAAEMRRKTAP